MLRITVFEQTDDEVKFHYSKLERSDFDSFRKLRDKHRAKDQGQGIVSCPGNTWESLQEELRSLGFEIHKGGNPTLSRADREHEESMANALFQQEQERRQEREDRKIPTRYLERSIEGFYTRLRIYYAQERHGVNWQDQIETHKRRVNEARAWWEENHHRYRTGPRVLGLLKRLDDLIRTRGENLLPFPRTH